jgi:2'-5' RNA ligase
MNIPIKSDIPKSMKAYLQILNPILKLKDKEIEVLSSFLSIWQSNRDNANLDKMLFSTPVRKLVRKQIDMSEASFNNHITMLRKKQMIVDKKINPTILNGIDKEGIEITYKITWTE